MAPFSRCDLGEIDGQTGGSGGRGRSAERPGRHHRCRTPRRGVRLDRLPVAARFGEGVRADPGPGAPGGGRAGATSRRRRRPGWPPGAPARSAWWCRSRTGGSSPRCSPGWRARCARRATTCCSTTSASRPAGSTVLRGDAAAPPGGRGDRGRVLVRARPSGPRCCALEVPLAVVGGHVPGFPRVGIDDAAGAASAVRHLLLLGHRDIAMISGDPQDPVGPGRPPRRGGPASRRRWPRPGSRSGRTGWCAEPWGVAGGTRAMEQLLARRHAADRGLRRVGRDGARRAADAAPGRAGGARPGLAGRLRRPRDGAGRRPHHGRPAGAPAGRARRLAADRGARRRRAGRAASVLLPTRLVVRGSTGPPASPPWSTDSAFA